MLKRSTDITLNDLKSGDEAAFKGVYEINREKFLQFSKKYNLSEEENVDLYQDAYIIFYENIMSGKITKFTSSISTYLFSIGKYLILDKLRKNKKEGLAHFDLELVKEEGQEHFEIDKSQLSQEQSLLMKYFDTISKQCQYLLTLFYYNGLSIKEIMQTENYKNKNVVKSQKSRCLKTLKERINENAE